MTEEEIAALPHHIRQTVRFWQHEHDNRESPLLKAQAARAIEEAVAKANRRARRPFTTGYAVRWAKAQGWKVTDRERWDARLNRHHDLAGGSDVCAMTPDRRRVWIQAAGRGERQAHYKRFMERKGELADGERFVYVVFERGNTKPLTREDWQ